VQIILLTDGGVSNTRAVIDLVRKNAGNTRYMWHIWVKSSNLCICSIVASYYVHCLMTIVRFIAIEQATAVAYKISVVYGLSQYTVFLYICWWLCDQWVCFFFYCMMDLLNCLLIRPPGTVIREVFYFARDFSFFSVPNLRAPSADRRETLPHDWKLVQFYNAGAKLLGRSPPPQKKKIGGQKHAKFRSILYLLRLWSLISLERLKISKIGKLIDREQFLLCYTKKVRWTLVH